MTTDSGFDMERHRQWLAGLGTPELQQHTARLDPSQQPEAWRAAVEELSRRGIVFTQQPPQAAYPPQYAYPPQPPYPTAYPAPPAGARKKGSIPLGVRMGCMGCLGMFLIYAAIIGFGFKAITSGIFPEMVGGDVHTVSADGWFGVVYDSVKPDFSRIKSGGEMNRTRFYIFENSKWREAPAPREAGPMVMTRDGVLLLGEKGEYTLPLLPGGRPDIAWSGPEEIDENKIDCPRIFQHGGVLYYLYQPEQDDESDETEDETSELPVLFNRSASELVTSHPLLDWLSNHSDTSVCDIRVIGFQNRLMVFETTRDKRTGRSALMIHTLDKGEWRRSQFPDTLMVTGEFEPMITDDNLFLLYIHSDMENMKSPMDVFKNQRKGFMQLRARRLRGDSWARHEEIPLGQGMIENFKTASDGAHHYVIANRIMSGGFDVIKRENGVWKSVAAPSPAQQFSPFSFLKSPYMFLFVVLSQVVLVVIVILSSMMISKERDHELVLSGHVVAMPTLLRRFAAFAIDFSIFYLPFIMYQFFYMDKMFKQPSMMFSNPKMMLGSMVSMLGMVVFIAYNALCDGLWGRTLGKSLMGLRVVREDLTRCGIGWAALRNVLRILDGMFYYAIGGIVFAHTDKFQRVGDLAAKTVVVMDAPALPLPPGSVPPASPPMFNAPPPQTPYNPTNFSPPPQ